LIYNSLAVGRPVSHASDFPVVDLAEALHAIETWKSVELGWHALRRFDCPRIEPAPDWQHRLHEIARPLRRGYDPARRHHYWEAVPEFDELLVEAVWASRIPMSLDHPVLPLLRPAFRCAWAALIDIIERRRAGDWRV
jgi:hypothetical protein